MIAFMPSRCFSSSRTTDSLIVTRTWSYYEQYANSVKGIEQNVYMVYQFGLKRRNPLLFLVPTMYSIAKGKRRYIGETYNKLKYNSNSDFNIKRQVYCGTIPHNRGVMPVLFELTTPNVYGVQLYPNRLLSPFHRTNRFFYKYSVSYFGGQYATIFFRPRSANTQLIKGHAVVDAETGYVWTLNFEGEFDMMRFRTAVIMSRQQLHSTLPEQCTTEATFKFVGNRIDASLTSYYDCTTTLPDSVNDVNSLEMMSTLRPKPLPPDLDSLYIETSTPQQEEVKADTTAAERREDKLKHVAWDIIGDNVVNSIRANTGAFSFYVSPLFNPFYMSYSNSKGIAYKLNFAAQYDWNSHRYLTFSPQIGYNTKRKQFYYTLPLRMTYNPKRNGYAELRFGNGERISNDFLAEAFKNKMGPKTNMPEFKDKYVTAVNNIAVFDWLQILGGVIYHQRNSLNPTLMEQAGMPSRFDSFSTTLTLRLALWQKGPILTSNWEHSFKDMLGSDLEYDRWEFDAVYKYNMKNIRMLNLRSGVGFYTKRTSNYFVDFTNFRDNNLPTGWDDDWTGQFQLVPSRWYNKSRYYFRAHASFDSPMLALSWAPWIGQFIETERIYVSALSIQDTRPYVEIGYGFKNRIFSTAFFASFLDLNYQKFECKFTFELFRRW